VVVIKTIDKNMGLDMSLHKKTYVKNWNHTKPEERYQITIKKGGKTTKIDTNKIIYIEEEVMDWRKSNQIHKWFVDNVQDGEDDCKDHAVSYEQLEELLDLIKKVLKNPTKAKTLLPTQAGFFFGDEEYGKYYFEDLKRTEEELTKTLKETDKEVDFVYHSSW